MKYTPFLDFHNKCIKRRRRTPQPGCCPSFEFNAKKLFTLFRPTEDNLRDYKVNMITINCPWYWASGDQYMRQYQYTKFRETIVLFCAVINNEL